MIEINIAKDFSATPGGRFISDGKFSGEEFRENILLKKYKQAKSEQKNLVIDLDGCFGYPSSFIDEAFGGLARQVRDPDILKIIEFVSLDESSLPGEIKKIMSDGLRK